MIQELRTGGAERIVVTLAHAGVAAGDVLGVAAAPGELDAELPAACERFPLPVLHRELRRLPRAAWQLRAAVRRFRPDVVHVHNPAMALVTALARTRHRGPALVSVHGVPEDDWSGAARLLRLSRIPVVGCGPGVSAGLREVGCDPVATIPNGVSAAPPPMDPRELRATLGLASDVRIVLVVGRLVEQKNQALAVQAMPLLDDDVRLVLVGEGPTEGALQALSRELGVADRVVFAGRRPARPLMGGADVLCLPSKWEGMPLVGLEAMASGRPLVVTAVRGNRELVEDGRTGLVTRPDDPTALADGLRRLLHDAQLSARLATAAAAVAASCSEEAMVTAYAELYRTLTQRRAAA